MRFTASSIGATERLAVSNGLCDRVDIVVALADGKQSVLRIGSAITESGMLNSIAGLGKALLPLVGNARRSVGDVGDMIALG
jgi:hypothetical protein